MRLLKNEDDWREMLKWKGLVSIDSSDADAALEYPPPTQYPCFADTSGQPVYVRYIYRHTLYEMLHEISSPYEVVIEKDLAGILLTQPLMDTVHAEVVNASVTGARSVDLIIRRIGTPGNAFPAIIVDYGGELLQTLAKAIQLIHTPERKEIARALNLAKLWQKVGSEAEREYLAILIEVCAETNVPLLPWLDFARQDAELNQQVVEAAVKQRTLERTPAPVNQVIDGGKYEEAVIRTRMAVDALIAAREKARAE